MLIAKLLAAVALISWLSVTGQRVLHAWQTSHPADAAPQAGKHPSSQVQLAGFHNRR